MENSSAQPQRKPPGPKGLPFLGVLLSVRKDLLGYLTKMHRKYGDFFTYKLGPLTVYQLCHPDMVKHVLQDHPHKYRKSPLYERMKPVLGNGLITSEGETWRKNRKLAQPAFHQKQIDQMFSLMTEETLLFLDSWNEPPKKEMDVISEMMRLTGHIIIRTMFGKDALKNYAGLETAWNACNKYLGKRFWALTSWSAHLPTPTNLKFKAGLKILNNFLYHTIKEKRAAGLHEGNWLSILMESRDEKNKTGLSDEELKDEMMTIFLAGHETTSLALSWTFYLLSKHPLAVQKLLQEYNEVLTGDIPTLNDIPKLSYTRMVLEEAMRLYPPAYGIGREALEDDRIGDYFIPKGSVVFIYQYLVHRSPSLWENPEEFNPERFLPEKVSQRPRFAYFPFGGGPRTCIGNSFAMTEMLLILPMILRRFRLDLVPGHPIETYPSVTLHSRQGIKMTIHRRE